MSLDLKKIRMFLLFFFWGWVALSQGTKCFGPCVDIAKCKVREGAEHSMMESNILSELAEAATKNQGGNKAIKGIKGLRVKDIRPPNISMEYVPNMGMRMTVTSQMTIAGKSFIGGTMEITVATNMTTESKMTVEKGHMKLAVFSCVVKLLSCKTNLPSSMLPKIVNKFLNSTLVKVMPGMMCPAADKVVAAMMKSMQNMWEERKCGSHGSITYSMNSSPKITSHHARVCFQAQLKQANGEEVDLPTTSVVLDDSDMPLGNENSDLLIPVSFLNIFMELHKETLDQDVSSDTMDGGPALSSDAIKEKVPSMEIPGTYDNLMSKIRSASTPTWILEEGAASLNVLLTIEFVAVPQQEPIFVVAANLKISTTFQLLEEKLLPSFEDSSLENLELKSSEVGTFDPELLSSYILDILVLTSIPALRTAMRDGVPLPSMMGVGYREPTIEIHLNVLRAIVGCEAE